MIQSTKFPPQKTRKPTKSPRAKDAKLGALLTALMAASALLISACGQQTAPATATQSSKLLIVVSYSVLGSLVQELVGDQAQVYVPIPNGMDPHEWEPSAQDAAEFAKAKFIVINGLGLEEGLEKTLEQLKGSSTVIYEATSAIPEDDHLEGEAHDEHKGEADGEHADEPASESDHADEAAHEGEEDHSHEEHDPHIWMSPYHMRSVIMDLSPKLDETLGIDTKKAKDSLVQRLDDLDAEIGALVASLPADQRKLVTGHESLGYFADRYGFTLIGTIIPGMSSQAEENAADLAALYRSIKDTGVKAIFSELGTPEAVARGLSADTGAKLVQLTTHGLLEDGSYFTFMRNLAQTVVQELR